ncbi:hypothetical protein MKK69_02670 [Methylobacterium sp. J-026]|uniref:hypothetical protein n=1 Tax=Methylobacterium sp. J-026 TaxID=2836624 RepID=UPI001FB91424|nr:hypothetical protein [Methylobacterium sp. J-026]MCJ2132980.1 hypothetical protein [Methylobacterium sp. J-026]
MRRLLKFLHTMGAAGVLGAMAALVAMLSVAPAPAALPGYAAVRGAMGAVATWVFLPSLALCLMSGLLAMALNRAFVGAGWAWIKLATGVLMFEGGLVYVQGPMRREAEQSARALAGLVDPAVLAVSLPGERGTLWVLLAVSAANVVLGIWRPRVLRIPT